MKVGDYVRVLKSVNVVCKGEREDVDEMVGVVTSVSVSHNVTVDIPIDNGDSFDIVSIEANECYLDVVENNDIDDRVLEMLDKMREKKIERMNVDEVYDLVRKAKEEHGADRMRLLNQAMALIAD